MTRTFAVDANNDLVIGGDDRLSIVSGLEAVLQNCEHAAKTILNEMVLAQGEGIPYFEAVWIGVPNLAVWEASFRARNKPMWCRSARAWRSASVRLGRAAHHRRRTGSWSVIMPAPPLAP